MTSRLALRSGTRGRLAGAAMLFLLLGTIAWPGAAAAQGGADDPKRIEYKWQLLEYRDGGELTPVPPGIGITMLLFANTVSIEAACSSARGEFDTQADSITIAPPEIEARGCDPVTQAIDDAFYEGLSGARTWTASGGGKGLAPADRPPILTLKDEVGEPLMTLTSATLPADPGLSRWDLGRIGAADGAIAPVITGVKPWIEFQRGGHVVGSSGCGSFLGTYTTNGTTMRIGDLVTARPDCPSEVREQADTIITTLGEVSDFEVLPAGLVLKDDAGLTRLAFVPAIDLKGRTWTPFQVLRDGKVLEAESGLLSTSAVRFAGPNGADGRSICRIFNGRQLSSGLALTVVGLQPDEAYGCGKPRKGQIAAQDVEDAFLGALERTASHALRGDELVLMDVDGNTVLRLEPQAALAGPTWVLAEIETAPAARKPRRKAPVGDQPITAVFEELGFLHGSTGVTDYDAEYDQPRGGQIDISDPQPVGTDCRGRNRSRTPLCVQQARFLQYLDDADVIVVRADGSEMRLHQGERILLKFVPESLATQPTEDEAPAEDAEA